MSLMNHPSVLEGIARDVHDGFGVVPIEAFELADYLGLGLSQWSKGYGQLRDDVVSFPSLAKVRYVRQQGIIVHECAHWLMRDHGLQHWQDENSARYLAGALMLPRESFLRDVDATDLDLVALEYLYPNASGEMIVARMTQVLPATAWVWDSGKLKCSYGIPCDAPMSVMDRVLAEECAVNVDGVRAWPRFHGSWRRVLAVRRAA